MSEDFDNISAAPAGVEDVGVGAPEAASTMTAEPAPEPLPSEGAGVELDVTPSSDTPPVTENIFQKIGSTEVRSELDNNAQNAAAEHSGGMDIEQTVEQAPTTQRGRDKEEARKLEAQSRSTEAILSAQEAEKRRHEETLERFDSMSYGDLRKMMDFISNPAIKEAIAAKLGKSGMSADKIQKGMKENEEYLRLRMKEEKDGKGSLSPDEQRRLQEIRKSEEFQAVLHASEELARERGFELSGNSVGQFKEAKSSYGDAGKAKAISELDQFISASNKTQNITSNTSAFDAVANQSFGRSHFTSAEKLTEKFTASAAPSAPMPAPSVDLGFDSTVPAAFTQAPKAKPQVDLAFG